MHVKISDKKTIEIDEDVIQYIKDQEKDFRVCTTCTGAEILPITYKTPKISDIRVKIGNNILYISRVQANYISKIDRSMLRSSRMLDLERCFL